MKKIFSCIVVCFCVMFAGFFLGACDFGGDRTLKFDMQKSLLQVRVIANRQEVEPDVHGEFVVEDQSDVRCELYATRAAVNISNINIKVNNVQKTLQKNDQYNPLQNNGSLYCGYFLLPKLDESVEISISGVEAYRSAYTFTTQTVENEETKLLLQQSEIAFDDEFVNLYDVLKNGTSFVRDYDNSSGIYNKHHVFKVKIPNGDVYNFSKGSPFILKYEDGRVHNPENYVDMHDYIVVDLGKIEFQNDYSVLVDFDKLHFKEYNFNLPDKNLVCSVTTKTETTNFGAETELYVNKLFPEANYSNVSVKLDDLELKMISEDKDKLTFKIPAKIKPQNGNTFEVEVSGWKFNAPTHKVGSMVECEDPFYVEASVYTVSDAGDKLDMIGVEDGKQIVLENQNVVFEWATSAENNSFQLYDHDIFVNDVLLFNLKEVLSQNTENFTNLSDLEIELDGGFVLKATFDETFQTYNNFKLQTICKQDLTFALKNFKTNN